ncbi:MAG: segregation/condensation protein A [Chloroflexi bacterium]|nr:segregation/condensation protein A [Chloroflexota bacterium]
MTAGREQEAPRAGVPDARSGDDAAPFALRLPAFEGPLDLLLQLIERRELDVTAVSLLEVTEQYLAHLRAADRIDVARLAEFIAIGARLLLLKSRALLPRAPEEGEESAEEDDAEALVAALREYRRYRDLAGELRARGEAGRSYRREAPAPERPPGSGLDGVEMETLAAILRGVLERFAAEQDSGVTPVQRERVRLRDRIEVLVARLEEERRLSFRSLLEGARSRLQVVVDFLAVLELIKAGFVEATQTTPFGDIELERRPGALPPVPAQLALDLPDQ